MNILTFILLFTIIYCYYKNNCAVSYNAKYALQKNLLFISKRILSEIFDEKEVSSLDKIRILSETEKEDKIKTNTVDDSEDHISKKEDPSGKITILLDSHELYKSEAGKLFAKARREYSNRERDMFNKVSRAWYEMRLDNNIENAWGSNKAVMLYKQWLNASRSRERMDFECFEELNVSFVTQEFKEFLEKKKKVWRMWLIAEENRLRFLLRLYLKEWEDHAHSCKIQEKENISKELEYVRNIIRVIEETHSPVDFEEVSEFVDT